MDQVRLRPELWCLFHRMSCFFMWRSGAQPWWWLSFGARMISAVFQSGRVNTSHSHLHVWWRSTSQINQYQGFWMVLDGSGWLWMVLNGFTMVFGWFWQLADYLQFLKEIVTLSPSQLKGVAVDFPEFLILMPGMPRGCPGDRAKLSRGCLELPSGND